MQCPKLKINFNSPSQDSIFKAEITCNSPYKFTFLTSQIIGILSSKEGELKILESIPVVLRAEQTFNRKMTVSIYLPYDVIPSYKSENFEIKYFFICKAINLFILKKEFVVKQKYDQFINCDNVKIIEHDYCRIDSEIEKSFHNLESKDLEIIETEKTNKENTNLFYDIKKENNLNCEDKIIIKEKSDIRYNIQKNEINSNIIKKEIFVDNNKSMKIISNQFNFFENKNEKIIDKEIFFNNNEALKIQINDFDRIENENEIKEKIDEKECINFDNEKNTENLIQINNETNLKDSGFKNFFDGGADETLINSDIIEFSNSIESVNEYKSDQIIDNTLDTKFISKIDFKKSSDTDTYLESSKNNLYENHDEILKKCNYRAEIKNKIFIDFFKNIKFPENYSIEEKLELINQKINEKKLVHTINSLKFNDGINIKYKNNLEKYIKNNKTTLIKNIRLFQIKSDKNLIAEINIANILISNSECSIKIKYLKPVKNTNIYLKRIEKEVKYNVEHESILKTIKIDTSNCLYKNFLFCIKNDDCFSLECFYFISKFFIIIDLDKQRFEIPIILKIFDE